MNPSIKSNTDYSNTIIYKITCKDPAITDLYVGHTTNFVERKNAHMNSCKSPKTANHKCKLYETIRSNGGWSNWRMDIIAFFECDDLLGAKKKEQEYYVSLKATLNSIEPSPLPKEKRTIVKNKKNKQTPHVVTNEDKHKIYRCDTCNISYKCSKLLDSHLKTNKHIKRLVCDISNKCKYICTLCNYSTSRNSQYNRHILTPKHILRINDNKNGKIDDNGNAIYTNQPEEQYVCVCGKGYKYCSGLSRHKNICKIKCNINNNYVITDSMSDIDALSRTMPSNDRLVRVDTDNVQIENIQNTPVYELQNSNNILYDLLKEVRVTNKELCTTNKQNIELQTQILEYIKSK